MRTMPHRNRAMAGCYGQPTVCDDGVTLPGSSPTTSTIPAFAVFQEGLRNVVAGSSAVAIKRGLERATEVEDDGPTTPMPDPSMM